MRKVPVEKLEQGMILARPVYDALGMLLLNTGIVLKREYINNLKKLNVPAVYITDEVIADVIVEDIIFDETRNKAKTLIKGMLQEIEGQPSQATQKLLFAKKKLGSVIDEIIEQLVGTSNIMVNLSDIRSTDEYTFAHSVNVAVLAVTTALSMGFPRPELQKIGVGAMLHDLGKIKVPLEILNKQGKLTPEEFSEIKKHPIYGYEMVKSKDIMDASSSMVIYQHHERMNGKGYPEGSNGEGVHTFAKICAVVDVYDALVADRPYRKALPQYKAFDILEAGGEEFDNQVLSHFLRHIAAYPVGTYVELSNGVIGVVVHNSVGYPRCPNVRVLFEADEREPLEPYEIDLLEHMDIVVKRVYHESELPQKVKKLESG